MKKKLICLLVVGVLLGIVLVGLIFVEIKVLQVQVVVLQKQMKVMQVQFVVKLGGVGGGVMFGVSGGMVGGGNVVVVVVDLGLLDYGKVCVMLINDEVSEMKQQIVNQQLKVDLLIDVVNIGLFVGLLVIGYIDLIYIYNCVVGMLLFLFVNYENVYNYFNSMFGDFYFDIKKIFGVGLMVLLVEIMLMLNCGNGIMLLQNLCGLIIDNLLNMVVINVLIIVEMMLVVGLILSFGGYEVQQLNQMFMFMYNLLYDFFDLGSYVGVGVNYMKGVWVWKFFFGNEQYCIYGLVMQMGINVFGDLIIISNKVLIFIVCVDYMWLSVFDFGGLFNIGCQMLLSVIDVDGVVYYGLGGVVLSGYGLFFFGEFDVIYMFVDVQYNVEVDYGWQQYVVFNGGFVQWYGLLLFVYCKFNVLVVGCMGVMLCYDLFVNLKNGGGGGGIVLNGNGMDLSNGFGVDVDCFVQLKVGGGLGFECKGVVCQDVVFDLLFYLIQQIIVKVEYWYDWVNNKVFLCNDGLYGKFNDLFVMQFIYLF